MVHRVLGLHFASITPRTYHTL